MANNRGLKIVAISSLAGLALTLSLAIFLATALTEANTTILNQKDEVFGFYNLENNYCNGKTNGDLLLADSETTKNGTVITTDITCTDHTGKDHSFTETYDQRTNLIGRMKGPQSN